MIVFLVIVVIITSIGFYVLQLPQFGQNPSGERLAKIEKSPNYKDGIFQNLSPTPMMAEEGTFFNMIKAYWNSPKTSPANDIPFIKTDLKSLEQNTPSITWFGHSSYLIKINGKNILIDPVFSGYASPFSFSVKSYQGANEYQVEDFPALDYVFITHDHYDHLDYNTIQKLISKTKTFVTSIGVGSHLEYWGVNPANIIELDWWDSSQLDSSLKVTSTPSRHFSGRGFTRGKTLWSAFVLESDTFKIYLGGDSGYDTHFKKVGVQFGGFDIAILECGQYNKMWKYIHMMPEEVAQAAKDLNAKVLMPVHWSKFTLAIHEWNEPIKRVKNAAEKLEIPITTPKIGETIKIGQSYLTTAWWE